MALEYFFSKFKFISSVQIWSITGQYQKNIQMSYLYLTQSRKKVPVFSPSMTYLLSGHYLILLFFLKVFNQLEYSQ